MHKILFLITLFFSSTILADPVWIDVRTQEEYEQSHIEGDIRISYEEIVTEVTKRFPDKETEIHLYCRSGRRSGIALEGLKAAGYTNVFNAGGIEEVRQVQR